MTDLTPSQRAAVDQASAHLRDLQADLEIRIALIRGVAEGITDTLATDERFTPEVARALAQVLTERYPLRGRS